MKVLLRLAKINPDKAYTEHEANSIHARDRAEQTVWIPFENLEYFTANRDEIVAAVRSELEAMNYRSALLRSKKYLATNDEVLTELYREAEQGIKDLEKPS